MRPGGQVVEEACSLAKVLATRPGPAWGAEAGEAPGPYTACRAPERKEEREERRSGEEAAWGSWVLRRWE